MAGADEAALGAAAGRRRAAQPPSEQLRRADSCTGFDTPALAGAARSVSAPRRAITDAMSLPEAAQVLVSAKFAWWRTDAPRAERERTVEHVPHHLAHSWMLGALPTIRILHDCSSLLVVDKPPGLPFHCDASSLGVLQCLRASGAHTSRLYGVHRLDRVTSGILVFTKSAEDAGLLSAAFRTGAVCKLYVALSARRPSKKEGTVSGDLAAARRGAHKLLRTQTDPARTSFVSSGVVGGERPLRGFVLRPSTGRTHQLRVALKALGAPVLGDALYADAAEAACEERAYLHAAALRLPPLRVGEQPLSVICPPSCGAEFLTPAFAAWFASRFPPSMQDDAVWFSGEPLLRSQPPGDSDEWQRRLHPGVPPAHEDWDE